MNLTQTQTSTTYFTASTWRRVLAYLVDQAVVMVLLLPLWIQVLSQLFDGDPIFISWRWLAVAFFFHLAYDWLFLYFMSATPGKLLFGLRVVSFPAQQDLTLFQALLRPLTDRFAWLFSNGLRALAFLRFDRRHVSDWVAETQVRQRYAPTQTIRPHVVWALILCLYFSLGGLASALRLLQSSEFSRDGVSFAFFAGDSES